MSFEYYRDLVVVLTQKEIKVRYKSSLLGYIWSVAHPLFLTVIFYFAFGIVMKIPKSAMIENYTLFLIAGLFPWQWVMNSVNIAPLLFLGNASLIKKTNFPREAVILADVVNNMVHFVLSIPVILAFMFFFGQYPTWSWIYGLPILIIIQFFLVCGLSLIIASINLFFRDLERIVNLATMALFYATPIFYHESQVPPQYQFILKYNPFSPLVISWRNLFLSGAIDWMMMLNAFISGLVIFIIGYYIFRALRWRFAEVL
jgi:lipopolysaccharide transport system permease protein